MKKHKTKPIKTLKAPRLSKVGMPKAPKVSKKKSRKNPLEKKNPLETGNPLL